MGRASSGLYRQLSGLSRLLCGLPYRTASSGGRAQPELIFRGCWFARDWGAAYNAENHVGIGGHLCCPGDAAFSDRGPVTDDDAVHRSAAGDTLAPQWNWLTPRRCGCWTAATFPSRGGSPWGVSPSSTAGGWARWPTAMALRMFTGLRQPAGERALEGQRACI